MYSHQSLVVVEMVVMFRFMIYRQAEEMEQAVQNVGKTYTDDQINMLAQRHFENSQVRNLDKTYRGPKQHSGPEAL